MEIINGFLGPEDGSNVRSGLREEFMQKMTKGFRVADGYEGHLVDGKLNKIEFKRLRQAMAEDEEKFDITSGDEAAGEDESGEEE